MNLIATVRRLEEIVAKVQRVALHSPIVVGVQHGNDMDLHVHHTLPHTADIVIDQTRFGQPLQRGQALSPHPHPHPRTYLQCQSVDGHHADYQFLLHKNIVIEEQQTETIDHFDDHFGIMLTRQ